MRPYANFFGVFFAPACSKKKEKNINSMSALSPF